MGARTPAEIPALVELESHGVFRLGMQVAIDDRSGWVPPGTKGFEAFNVYAVRSDDACLVIDSGPAVMASDVLTQLREVQPFGPVDVVLTRNEFEVIGGLASILAEFSGSRLLYPGGGTILDWIDYRQNIGGVPRLICGTLNPCRGPRVGRGDLHPWRSPDDLVSFRPPLGTLSMSWLFDETSGSLFTSDAFSFLHIEGDESIVCDALPERTTPDYVAAHLAERFFWLRRTTRNVVKRDISDVFSNRRVSMICPSRGRVIRGAETVAKAVELTLAGIDLLTDETY